MRLMKGFTQCELHEYIAFTDVARFWANGLCEGEVGIHFCNAWCSAKRGLRFFLLGHSATGASSARGGPSIEVKGPLRGRRNATRPNAGSPQRFKRLSGELEFLNHQILFERTNKTLNVIHRKFKGPSLNGASSPAQRC